MYPDFFSPTEGGIQVTGAVSTTLRYVAPYEYGRCGTSCGYGSYIRLSDRPFSTREGERSILHVFVLAGNAAYLTHIDANSDTTTYSWEDWYGTRMVSAAEPQDLVVEAIPWQLTSENGATVSFEGSATISSRKARAGREILLFSEAANCNSSLVFQDQTAEFYRSCLGSGTRYSTMRNLYRQQLDIIINSRELAYVKNSTLYTWKYKLNHGQNLVVTQPAPAHLSSYITAGFDRAYGVEEQPEGRQDFVITYAPVTMASEP